MRPETGKPNKASRLYVASMPFAGVPVLRAARALTPDMNSDNAHGPTIKAHVQDVLGKAGVAVEDERRTMMPRFTRFRKMGGQLGEDATVHVNPERRSAVWAREAGHATGWRGLQDLGKLTKSPLGGVARGAAGLTSLVQAMRSSRDANEGRAREKLHDSGVGTSIAAGLHVPTILEELRANKRAYGLIRESGLGRMASLKQLAPILPAMLSYVAIPAAASIPYFMARHSVAKRFGKPDEDQPKKQYMLP